MDKIQSILSQKFHKQNLAHFYLLSPAQRDDSNQLDQWMHVFLQNLTHKTIANHPDILLITSDPEKRSYKWEELSGIYKFLNHAPLEWNQKIIYIADAHKITEIVANKLLKVLEEPPIACTFFISNPLKKSLLHTIESRAIHLRLPMNDNDVANSAINDDDEFATISNMSLFEFIEFLKNSDDPSIETKVVKYIISNSELTYEQVTKLLQHAKTLQVDSTFYNSPQYRYTQLFSAISLSSER